MDARSQVPTARLSDTGNNQTVNRSSAPPSHMPLNRPDLRLILTNRFMRMLRLHDQARDQLLTADPTSPPFGRG